MSILVSQRTGTLEAFSTFLYLNQNHKNTIVTRWRISQQLKINFDDVYNRKTATFKYKFDDCDWFFFCLELAELGSNILAKEHLAAYLEEPCYWAAKRISAKIRIPKLSENEVFAEAFSTGRLYTNNLEAIAAKFKSYDKTKAGLKKFSEIWLYGVIIDELYKKYNIGKYSDWGLLKNASKTLWQEALSNLGLNETKIAIYTLAWQCFKDTCFQNTGATSTKRKITRPNQLQIEEIVNLYNRRRLENSLIFKDLSPKELELVMEHCIKALRKQEKAQSILNCAESLSNFDLDSSETEKPKLIIKASVFEQQTLTSKSKGLPFTKEQLYSFLLEEFQKLKDSEKNILTLAYGLALQQTEIGKSLGEQQYNISRQLKAISKAIALGIVKRVKASNTPTVKDFVEEWLEDFCKIPFTYLAFTAFKKLDEKQKHLLRLYYGGDYKYSKERLKNTEIALKLKIAPTDTTEKINEIKQHFCLEVKNYAQNYLGINLDLNNPKIDNLVEKWLAEKALYNLLLST